MLHRFSAHMLFFLFLGVGVLAAQSPDAKPQHQDIAATVDLPPDAPVITMQGLCAQDFVTGAGVHLEPAGTQRNGEATASATASPTQDKGSCKTVVTRAQMDKLLYALDPKGSVNFKVRLLKQYPEILIFAQYAHEHGEENDPAFLEHMRFNYIESLGKAQLGQLKKDTQNVSAEEAEKYYKEHPDRYVELALLKIMVPQEKAAPSTHHAASQSNPGAGREMSPAALAEQIRKQAVAGENFDRLQERVYELSGRDKDDAPDTDVGDKWTIDLLPKEFAQTIFNLKPGQVSPVIDFEGFYLIYKLVSKHTIPLSEADAKTQQLLYNDAYKKIRDAVNVTVDEQYLKTPSKGTKETTEAAAPTE